MSSTLVCPQCQKTLKVPDTAIGKAIRCPACKADLPAAPSAVEDVVEAAASAGDEITTGPAGPPAARPRPAANRDEGRRLGDALPVGAAPIRKRSSTGLVLGLVLGGGFLFLLFAGCTGLIVYLTVFRDRTIPEAEWQTFAPPNGHFTVSMPGTPVNTSLTINGVFLNRYEVKRLKDNKAFVAGFFDLGGQALRPNLLETVAAAERDHMVRTINGRVTSESHVTLGGIEGREFQIVAPDRSVVIGRIYLARVGGKHRGFEVVAGGGLKPGKGDAARFFDSFKIDASASPPNLPGGPVAQGPPPVVRPPVVNRPPPNVNPKRRPKKRRDPSATAGQRPVWHEVGGEQTISLAFAPDGATLAVGHWNKRLRLWDVAGSTDRQVIPLDFGPALAVAYSKDGSRLALGTGGGRVVLWDAATRKEVQRFQVLHARAKDQTQVKALAFAPDGKSLAVGIVPGGNSNGEVHLWDLGANKERAALPDCRDATQKLAFAAEGALVVFLSSSVKVCDAATLQVRRELKALTPQEQFITAALSPDGRTLATFGDDRKLKLWRLSDGTCEKTWPMQAAVHRYSYFPLAFSPDGKLLALGGQGPNLYLWDAQTGKELKVRRIGLSAGFVGLVTFSPDGRWLACQSSNGPAILEVDKVLTGK